MNPRLLCWTFAFALAAVPASAASRANSAQRLMGDLHENALKASDTASAASLSSSAAAMDWEGYFPYVNGLREEINAMGEDLAHLKAMRDVQSPAARQALRRIEPLLKDVAAQTNQAIEFFNAHHGTLWQPEYVTRLKTISSESGRIASLINDARRLSTLRQRETALRRDLNATLAH